MSKRVLPRYPVYILSKGRSDCCLTAKCFRREGVPFTLVVEPQEADLYAAQFGRDCLFILPFSNLGLGGIPARNALWEHAKARGAERHWCIDDNIREFFRRYAGQRIRCDSGIALRVCEDFTDRYENIGISGLNYYMFVPEVNTIPPIQINCHVYSCILIKTDLPYRWRGRYNEDTDLCLQVLSSGEWCTVLLNTFLAKKMATMRMKGGNTAQLYQGDGRLKMARSLERMWPGVVETKRRFHRPQHVVKDGWKQFDTRLRLKPGIDLNNLPPNEYGMDLVQVKPVVQSKKVRDIQKQWRQTHTNEEEELS